MNDAQLEAIIDRRVQARLATDRDYLFAENSEQQALAERKIELQEEAAVIRSKSALSREDAWRLEDIEQLLGAVIDELRRS